MQITVFPMETGKNGLSEYIAALQEILRDRNVDYEINDMGTIINGPPALLFQLAEELHACPFQHGVQRVITQMTLDERRDKNQNLGEKKEAVLNILEKKKNS